MAKTPKAHRIKKVVRTVRLDSDLYQDLEQSARRSKWSIEKQIEYELKKPRGLWQEPYLPSGTGS